MSDKTGQEDRGLKLRDLGWGTRDPVPNHEPCQRTNSALEFFAGYIVCGYWKLT